MLRRARMTRVAATLKTMLCLLAIFALANCGSDSSDEPAEGTDASAVAQVVPQTISAPDGRTWRKLEFDYLHDPNNEMIQFLQEPSEALSVLPKGGPDGNQVDWVAALRQGVISPRTNILPETKIRVIDLDIVFEDTAGQPFVVFPHRPHTEWLDCENCHPSVFIAKRGANNFGMFDVLQGEYCGKCHGAVSFPLTECKRCHSLDKHLAAAN